MVPMASSQSCPSSAAATGCALPTVVLITSRFCAAFTSSTNSRTSRETGGNAGSDTASPGSTYPAPVLTRPSSWISRESVACPTLKPRLLNARCRSSWLLTDLRFQQFQDDLLSQRLAHMNDYSSY